MSVLLAGIMAGLLHVLSGADHTAAVAPLALSAPARSTSLGASWGLGHAAGTLLWLLAAWIFRNSPGLEFVSRWAEVLVGCSLIALSIGVLRPRHKPATLHDAPLGSALGFGLLHGTAGASHFLGVLPTLGLSTSDAVAYTVGYLLASLVAMMTISSVTAALSGLGVALRFWRYGSALFAFSIGCLWLAQFAS